MARVRGDKHNVENHELGNGVINSSGGSRGLQAPERRLVIKVASATGSWRGKGPCLKALLITTLFMGLKTHAPSAGCPIFSEPFFAVFAENHHLNLRKSSGD